MRTVLTFLTVLTCASAWGQAFSIFDPAMQAPPVASATPSDIKWITIETNGCIAQVYIEGKATYGTWDFNWGTNNAPASDTPSITLTRPGYSGGTATNRSDRVYLTKQLRLPYPDQLTSDITVVSGGVIARVWLSDWVYAADTNISATVPGNWYSNSIAGTVTVTNNSTAQYPPVGGCWAWYPFETATGSTYRLRWYAGAAYPLSGRPAETIVFTSWDTAGHTNSVTTNTPAIDTTVGDAVPFAEYFVDMPTSGFVAGMVTNSVRVYPWHGGTNAVLDTADGRFSTLGSLGYMPLVTRFDSANLGASAYVATNGNNTTGVVVSNSVWNASSPPAAFANIYAALNAISASNSAWFGVPGYSNSTVYCGSGTYSFPGGTVSLQTNSISLLTFAAMPDVPVEQVILGTASGTVLRHNMRFSGVSLNNPSSGSFAASPVAIVDQCRVIANNGSMLGYCTNIYAVRSLWLSGDNGLAPYSTRPGNFALTRGNTMSNYAGGNVQIVAVLGNRFIDTLSTTKFEARTHWTSGRPKGYWSVLAHNEILANTSLLNFNADPADISGNLLLLANIWQSQIPTLKGFDLWANDTVPVITNVYVMGNTMLGTRANSFYNIYSNNVVSFRQVFFRDNILDKMSVASDIETDGDGSQNGARIGNWPVKNGVGFSGNIIAQTYGIGTTPAQFEFAGVNSFLGTFEAGNSPTPTIFETNRAAVSGSATTNLLGNYNLRSTIVQPYGALLSGWGTNPQ